MSDERPVWTIQDEIVRPNLVIVEGRDDENLLGCLVDDLKLTNIQMMRIDGESSYPTKIRAITTLPGFDIVRVLGLVRDADANAHEKFESMRHALGQAGFEVPDTVLTRVGNDPEICVLILPSMNREGMIETCCLDSVENESAMSCVEEYMNCLESVSINPRQPIKSKLHAFLSSRDKPGLKIGEAARAGYFDFSHETFNDLKRFLNIMVS